MVEDSTSETVDKEELPNTSKLDFQISPGLTGYDYGVVVNININQKDSINYLHKVKVSRLNEIELLSSEIIIKSDFI